MTEEEGYEIFERLLTIWPHATIREGTATEYVRALTAWEFDEVQTAIDELSSELQFLPSIAEIVGRLDVPIPSRRMTADQLKWSGHNPENFPGWMLPPSDGPDDAGRIT